MPKQSQYLPRKQEIIKVCRQAREDCGIHWMANASAKLEIPPRTLQWLCHEWRIFYTNRQYYRKNKQNILAVIEKSRTITEAASTLGIPRSTLYGLRKKWQGTKGLNHQRARKWVNPDGKIFYVAR